MAERICSMEGCGETYFRRDWCETHYTRWLLWGDPRAVPTWKAKPRDRTIERFWANVNKDGPIPEHRPKLGPCWLWTASTGNGGYGQFAAHGKSLRAHRFSYELHVSKIRGKRVIDHLCRVPACVNPAHLESVTQKTNVRRGRGGAAARARQLAKTHCPYGHPYSGPNLYVTKDGRRNCRACRNRRSRSPNREPGRP